jgi:regulator of protease activity HflC (stomatin/prohibitin superfamily)
VTAPEGETPGEDPAALSASVSHHVRSLFAAAERSAAAIRAEAEEHAALITAKAEAEARRIREEARGDAAALLAARRRELASLSDEILRWPIRAGGARVGRDRARR